MTDFKTYYDQLFQKDIFNFIGQIPIEGNKHYDPENFNIQYFILTPRYNYLDIIPEERQGFFTVALYWTILFDQVFYSNYGGWTPKFHSISIRPKFIGNCTAPSLMSSQCGHHQHPSRIFEAVNDSTDIGNFNIGEPEIFKKDRCSRKRKRITYKSIIEESKSTMKSKVKEYLKDYSKINVSEFWKKCEVES